MHLKSQLIWANSLTHKQLKMDGCIVSLVDTDAVVQKHQAINTLRLRQNGRWLPDYISIYIFFNENI